MQRLDPVGITIKIQNGKVVFVPDPQGLIQTSCVVFFSNETNFSLDITLATKPFISVSANSVSDGIPMPASGPQTLGCSNHAVESYELQVSDQLTLIQPGAAVTFMPLLLATGNWVVWQNNDSQVHQPAPDKGTTWTKNPKGVQPFDWSEIVQFPTPGNYPYHCALHPAEVGSIVVADQQITINAGGSFNTPTTLTPGQIVAWINQDTAVHEPVPTSGPPWTSLPGPVSPNSWSPPVQFPTVGNYPYHCALHPSEQGMIEVNYVVAIPTGGGFGSPITLTLGQFVMWMNQDTVDHQPVPTSGPAWSSLPGPISPGDSTSVQFNAAGTYSYVCKFHPAETGQIIVS